MIHRRWIWNEMHNNSLVNVFTFISRCEISYKNQIFFSFDPFFYVTSMCRWINMNRSFHALFKTVDGTSLYWVSQKSNEISQIT